MIKLIQVFKTVFLVSVLGIMIPSVNAQTVITFENLTLASDTNWHGTTTTTGFTNGGVFFSNNYFPDWDGWDGFSYSNEVDMTTAGFGNQYSVFNTGGYNSSKNFAVVTPYPETWLKSANPSTQIFVIGFYITNTTYTALSMKNGDQFAKKFGGVSGDDKDSLVVTAVGYVNGVRVEDSVNFVLADYRFNDNSKDYIVDTWEWFDLSSLGYVDSVGFVMSSSDNGSWGMNTPGYFAMDNLIVTALSTNIEESLATKFEAYPNPATDFLSIDLTSIAGENVELKISNLQGQELLSSIQSGGSKVKLDISSLLSGVYLVTVRKGDDVSTMRLIKQ